MKTISLKTIKGQIIETLYSRDLETLRTVLDQLLMSNSNKVLVRINRVFSEPPILNFLIQLLRSNPYFFEKVKKESYYHENGFHKIVLLSGSYFKLRLHQFGACEKVPMENIHDHRWPFASSILTGRLEMDLFQTGKSAAESEKLFHFIYNSDKQTGSYSTTLQGQINMAKKETRCYEQGDTYLMLPHELHRIKNKPGEESITLILTGKPQSKLCNLYAKREILEQEKETIAYSESTLNSILDNIIEYVYPQIN
jgi:hypothetical protein